MPLLIAALLGLSAALIVAYPLLGLSRSARAAAQAGGVDEVVERERQARQALREVEFDYTLGNLEHGDYEALRGRYERRALAALRTRYVREQELDALIERQLDAMREQRTDSEDVESASEQVTRAAHTPRASGRAARPEPRVSTNAAHSLRKRRGKGK